jgi:hypothetical protein
MTLSKLLATDKFRLTSEDKLIGVHSFGALRNAGLHVLE